MTKWRKNGEADGELEIKALQLITKKLKTDYIIVPTIISMAGIFFTDITKNDIIRS